MFVKVWYNEAKTKKILTFQAATNKNMDEKLNEVNSFHKFFVQRSFSTKLLPSSLDSDWQLVTGLVCPISSIVFAFV